MKLEPFEVEGQKGLPLYGQEVLNLIWSNKPRFSTSDKIRQALGSVIIWLIGTHTGSMVISSAYFG